MKHDPKTQKRILRILMPTLGLLAMALAPWHSAQAQNQARIVGGQEANRGNYPWMTALVEKGQPADQGQFCGGALIHPEWVLTAAHCAEGVSPNNTDVVIGAHDLRNNDGYRVAITEVRIHPNYGESAEGSVYYDLALFRLARPVTEVPPVKLVTSEGEIDPGTLATVIGWGATSEGGNSSPVLRDVQVPIVSQATANQIYGDLNESNLAAGFAEGGKDSCQGDSGGPLVVDSNGEWALAGIVSFGNGCAQPDGYGIYAHVLNSRDWIESEPQRPASDNPPTGGTDGDFDFDDGDFDFDDGDFSDDGGFDFDDGDFGDDGGFDFDDGDFGDDGGFDFDDGAFGDDHSDDLEGATVLSVPGNATGVLEAAYDWDFFQFTLTSEQEVTLESSGMTDTVGYLETEDEVLAYDDSSGEDENFRITRPCPQAPTISLSRPMIHRP
ncbi:MAG: serine protease [Verrucomicrobiota bacterium]